jgi:hypothetical protein
VCRCAGGFEGRAVVETHRNLRAPARAHEPSD